MSGEAVSRSLFYSCPRCRGGVEREGEAYRCERCQATYPVVIGIPDFRIFPDPWIGLEEDRAKAERLQSLIGDATLEDAVRTYWEITPETPRALAERFVRGVLASGAEAREWLGTVEEAGPAGVTRPWLDIGCGTGALVAAASQRGAEIVGIDIALRWLVVARRRTGVRSEQLVCGNGEHLPFANAQFGRVFSVSTLEHCRDAGAVMREGHRVLGGGGTMHVKTTNRFTLLPEPHVHVWGVGFLPRRWADGYVRWRSGQRYVHHRPFSASELRASMKAAGFRDVRVMPSPLLPGERGRLGSALRLAGRLYEWMRRAPVVRRGVRWVAPLLDARGVAA
ncbi:MAG: methyltransferase domain-containing protein [Gemmatimonadaceae bacterium]